MDLPEAFANESAELARALKAHAGGRATKRGNYHLTLAFLGEIDEADCERAIGAAECACREASPLLLESGELGSFGRRSLATLWLGIRLTPQLEELVARLRAELSARGVPFDNKQFKAHITLVRKARAPKGSLPNLPFPRDAIATHITLFNSVLTQDGPIYKPLYSIDLSGKE